MTNSTYKITPKILLALFVTGLIAGCVGIILTHLLHAIQQLAFHGSLIAGEHISFRELTELATPTRRVQVLLVCGLVVGIGWTLLHHFGSPLVGISNAVKAPEKDVPVKTTICHAFLQIITVGLGSPLGREVAPREMSVALATPLSKRFGLSLLLACASGAGLAAVYNVPLAATVFVLETMLLSWSMTSLVAALLCCGTAVIVVRWGLGDLVQYGDFPDLANATLNPMPMLWAALAGIVLAYGVNFFDWCQKHLPSLTRTKTQKIFTALLAFAIIGVMSMAFPEILGNGKSGNQLSFAENLSLQYAMGLLATKWIAVLLAMMAGAYGGRITPSMMFGGLIAFLLAILWNQFFPQIPAGSAAFIGATVFLGIAQNMRLTAIIFMLELSRLSTAYWLPVCLCMGTALIITMWKQEKK